MPVTANGLDASRLGKLIRLLGSASPGEVAATSAAIGRVLEADGLDFHDLADRLTGKPKPKPKQQGLTTKDLERAQREAFLAGYEAGQRNAPAAGDDKELDWQEKAKFCLEHGGGLNERELDFIRNMVHRTVLESIYARLRT
jgi:hypothetical protein